MRNGIYQTIFRRVRALVGMMICAAKAAMITSVRASLAKTPAHDPVCNLVLAIGRVWRVSLTYCTVAATHVKVLLSASCALHADRYDRADGPDDGKCCCDPEQRLVPRRCVSYRASIEHCQANDRTCSGAFCETKDKNIEQIACKVELLKISLEHQLRRSGLLTLRQTVACSS